MRDFKFILGEEVKDKITGFRGVVMARSEYHTGCNTYGLLSKTLTKDAKPAEWEWIDERLLTSFRNPAEPKAKNVLTKAKKDNGGPHPNAPQM